MDEKKILLSLIEERSIKCDELQMITSSKFLDMNEKSLVTAMKPVPGVFRLFYGGFEEAERTVAVFLPEYTAVKSGEELKAYFEQYEEDNPLCLLKVEKDKFSKALTHRDYLGALMGLGIKRDVIGDIRVNDSGCEIACIKTMADYIKENLTKAGRGTLNIEITDFSHAQRTENEAGEEICFTVSSPRLDSIVKNAFGVSRDSACEAIDRGLVFVNDLQAAKPDKKIQDGDKIVLRHKGRFIVSSSGDMSKKGRYIIRGRKF